MITEMMKSMKPAASRSISRTRDGGDSRLEDIEEVYRSEDYKSYIKRMPKHRRGQRDPKTPDRKASMSSGAWGEKVSLEQEPRGHVADEDQGHQREERLGWSIFYVFDLHYVSNNRF